MEELEYISWFGHASFSFVDKYSNNRIYYIDPFDLPSARPLEKGELIFITHAHMDHCSFEDIKKISNDNSIIIATSDCLAKINTALSHKFSVLPNQNYVVREFPFQTIPAYNAHEKRLSFHPKFNNWVGYILNVNGEKIYHAGDTDFIPEMNSLKSLNIDIAMLPIGGTYTMDVDEAIQAANAISAKITIPIHYKRLLGQNYKTAEEQFKKHVINSKVVILKEVR